MNLQQWPCYFEVKDTRIKQMRGCSRRALQPEGASADLSALTSGAGKYPEECLWSAFVRHFLRGSSSCGGVGGGFCCLAPQYGRGVGGRGGTLTGTLTGTHTHRGTYTRMLHLPFSDLPLKRCPILGTWLGVPQRVSQRLLLRVSVPPYSRAT